MDYPKISIVTPNYNMGNFLEKTMCSVLNQGYPNLEYIVIDGGSTDCSLDIIKKYEPELSYWVSEPDQGLYHAIQKGFERSTGEIMAWINSDDMLHPGSLLIVAELLSQYAEIEWLSGAPTCYDEVGRTVYVSPARLYSRFVFLTHKHYDWIQQESTFWRRSLWEKAGRRLDTSLQLAGDFELWMRFFRYAGPPYVVSSLLGGFRLRKSNQKSLEGESEYRLEVNEIVRRELNYVIETEPRTIKKLRFYGWLKNVPLLSTWVRANEKYDWLLHWSPLLNFDRHQYKFVLTYNR
jgi:glycosyltransferase involved in cell wall biosynthesis